MLLNLGATVRPFEVSYIVFKPELTPTCDWYHPPVNKVSLSVSMYFYLFFIRALNTRPSRVSLFSAEFLYFLFY